MKNKIIMLVIAAYLPGAVVHAQVTIDKWTVANGGASLSGGTVTADCTIGQTVINYVTPGSLMIYEGFHPVDFSPILASNVVQNNELKIAAYPNPFAGLLHIKVEQQTSEPVTIEVRDGNGKLVINARTLPPATSINSVLDLSHLAAGLYTVGVSTSANNRQEMKVIRQ